MANRVYNWTEIQAFYDKGRTVQQCQDHFGFARASWANAVRSGRIISRGRKAAAGLEAVLVEGSSYSRRLLKSRLIEQGLLVEKCYECGQLPEWNNKKLVLALDHINGLSDDNRLENLRLLCPNCHSQTETFTGRNIPRRRQMACEPCIELPESNENSLYILDATQHGLRHDLR